MVDTSGESSLVRANITLLTGEMISAEVMKLWMLVIQPRRREVSCGGGRDLEAAANCFRTDVISRELRRETGTSNAEIENRFTETLDASQHSPGRWGGRFYRIQLILRGDQTKPSSQVDKLARRQVAGPWQADLCKVETELCCCVFFKTLSWPGYTRTHRRGGV